MTRNEEYSALLLELEQAPAELEQTVEKALKRERTSQKKRRVFGVSAAGLAACFAAFVLLVNLCVPFARACGGVPLLRELAKAVAWSPSLSAAVENDYVQPIGQSQTAGGVTATVEYVIVDRKQLNLFYTLDYDRALEDRVRVDYSCGDMEGWSGSTGSYGKQSGDLRQISLTFVDRDVPETLDLTLKVRVLPEQGEPLEADVWEDPFYSPEEPEAAELAEFAFHLEFDPYFTAKGEVIPVNARFTLEGQTFTLTDVELYPTHLRVNLEAEPDNTAWLEGLELYLENERGERFEAVTNGITASGDPDGEGFSSFWLDSPFFSRSEHLTLCVTGAKWLDKDAPPVRLDLAAGTAENLPEGVRFLGADRLRGGLTASFMMPLEPDGGMYGLFSSAGFWDEGGNHYEIDRHSATFGYDDPETGAYVDDGFVFTEEFLLTGYAGDVVYLKPWFNRVSAFGTPAAVAIK